MENKIGVHIPTILMPKKGIDMSRWSVVACDQYTSQPDYWDEVERFVGDKPSTLHLTLPEVYLESNDKDDRIKRINKAMLKYVEDEILVPQDSGFIFIDRQTSHAQSRKGLIMAVDLDEYDYFKGSQSLIRATEGTVIDRLPPRVKIREKAAIELPHIMLLIDDEDKTVIEPLANMTDRFEKLYDFDLMMNSGHIKGYKIDDCNIVENIIKRLEDLARPDFFRSKYGAAEDKGVLLFAVGDGNHSLASAKSFWENLKKSLPEDEWVNHPARFALVEVVNVHDDGLQFEPIHRVVFNIDAKALLDQAVKYYNNLNCEAYYKTMEDVNAVFAEVGRLKHEISSHIVPFITKDFSGYICVKCPQYNLEVGTLQDFLDKFLSSNKSSRIDYIHGDDVVKSLGTQHGNIGFFLPAMDKRDLFKTVILDGALPRKTFSMGEADEKRFYLESRLIKA